MARDSTTLLDHGDLFPRMELQLAGGGAITVPDPEGKKWNLLLVYRGHW